MCDEKGPPYKRTGEESQLTIKEAKGRFDQYYEENTKSNIGKFRAKLNDMMFQKKDKKTIRCDADTGLCEEGSVKYCHSKGPKTFDVEGVDYFEEGTKFRLEKPDGTIGEWIAKGHTKVKQIDLDTKAVSPSKKIGSKDKKIYAQRHRETGELISKRSQKQMTERKKPSGDLGPDKHLVDLYHAARKQNPQKYKKKSKKRDFYKKFNIGASEYEQYIDLLSEINTDSSPKHIYSREYGLEKGTLDIYHKNKVVAKDSEEYDIIIDYLQRLGLVHTKKRKYVWSGDGKNFIKIDMFDANNAISNKFILDLETGNILNNSKPHNIQKIGRRNKTLMDIWKEFGEPPDDEDHIFEVKGHTQLGGFNEVLSDYSYCSDEEEKLTNFWFNG